MSPSLQHDRQEMPLVTIYTLNRLACAHAGRNASQSFKQASFKQALQQAWASTSSLSYRPILDAYTISQWFPRSWRNIDAIRALIGLDHLKNLEHERQRLVGLVEGCESLASSERGLRRRYRHLYEHLGRWILIREVLKRTEDQGIALLNTIYPPTSRKGRSFFMIMQQARQNTGFDLATLTQHSKDWDELKRSLDKYLDKTGQIMDYCAQTISSSDAPSIRSSSESTCMSEIWSPDQPEHYGVVYNATEKLPEASRWSMEYCDEKRALSRKIATMKTLIRLPRTTANQRPMTPEKDRSPQTQFDLTSLQGGDDSVTDSPRRLSASSDESGSSGRRRLEARVSGRA